MARRPSTTRATAPRLTLVLGFVAAMVLRLSFSIYPEATLETAAERLGLALVSALAS